MSNLIVSDSQKQAPGSELVELFELYVTDSSIFYFHPGKNASLANIEMRTIDGTSFNSYVALPCEMTGVEYSADGAQNRPSLTVANVLTVFKDALGGLDNEDLIGQKIIRRKTYKKYLKGGSADPGASVPTIEFPRAVFFIDRIVSMNALQVEFELSSPFDLSGVELPGRQVVGKLCPWMYQGAASSCGGCTFPVNSTITIPTASGTDTTKLWYNEKDEILIHRDNAEIDWDWFTGTPSAQKYGYYAGADPGGIAGVYRCNFTFPVGTIYPDATQLGDEVFTTCHTFRNWTTAVSWVSGDTVNSLNRCYYDNHIWKCTKTHTSVGGDEPYSGSPYWIREDKCGKTLNSCRIRFQFTPYLPSGTTPSYTKYEDQILPGYGFSNRSRNVLPFGGFPGIDKLS